MIGGLLRAIGLHEVERHTEQHENHDDDGIDGVAEQRGDDARGEQNEHQRIREEQPQVDDAHRLPGGRGLVRPNLVEPPCRLFVHQAPLKRAQQGECLRPCVPCSSAFG